MIGYIVWRHSMRAGLPRLPCLLESRGSVRSTTKTVAGKVQEVRWDNLPVMLTNYSRGRDEIVKHVDGLIEQLAIAPRASAAPERPNTTGY